MLELKSIDGKERNILKANYEHTSTRGEQKEEKERGTKKPVQVQLKL